MLTHRPHLILFLCAVVASVAAALAAPPGGLGMHATCPQSPTPTASSTATCVTPTIGSFTATPNPVAYGGTVTLSWSASSPNPLTCKVSSTAGGGSGGATGSWTTGPLTSQTYFELYCWDAYGAGNTAGVTVGVTGSGGGASASPPTGWLDSVSSAGVVTGWSCDADSYGTSIYVQVYADGALAAQVQANVYRADVAAAAWACGGTGNHGFAYQLPAYLLNGQSHAIKVLGVNSDVSGNVVGSGDAELSGSPKTLVLGSLPFPDRMPPAVSITSPADGTVVTGAVPIAVSAGDNVGVAGVQIQLDGQNLGSELTAAPYSQTWNPSGVANGSHTLTAVARDAAGNRATASVTVLVSDSVTDGTGVPDSGDSLPITLQRSLASTGWCSGIDQRWGVGTAPHIQYKSLLTNVAYWKVSVAVDVCVDTRRHAIIGFNGQTVTPLYTMPVVWHYDNGPVWSFGPTGSKTSFSWAQVTDSFTGCPLGLPVGCNKVSFTVTFKIAGTGVYAYTTAYH